MGIQNGVRGITLFLFTPFSSLGEGGRGDEAELIQAAGQPILYG